MVGIDLSPGGLERSYEEYLVLRGYDASAGKLRILKRALVDSWGEPGFHRFWRVWNPGVGHLLYRLYLVVGGNRMRAVATTLVFLMCGIAHDVAVVLIFRRPFVAFTAAFVLCGVLTVVTRSLEGRQWQERWPRWLNACVNVALLAVSITAAVRLQRFIFP